MFKMNRTIKILLFLLPVLLLASGVQSETIEVNCGDEKCEYAHNRASTALRYTPDKFYKLAVAAVNTEVEIFGVSSEYFFIKYRGEFGFFPKQHLKERAKVAFNFPVMLDIEKLGSIKKLKEGNFLNIYAKSKTGRLDANLGGSDNLTEEEKKPEAPELLKTKEESPPAPEVPIPKDPVASDVNKTVTGSVEEKILSIDPATNTEAKKTEELINKVAPGATSEPGVEVSSEEQDNEDEDDEDLDDDEDSEEEDEEVLKLSNQPELTMIPNPKDPQANSTEEPKKLADPLENITKQIKEETIKPPTDEIKNDLPLTNDKVEENLKKLKAPKDEKILENPQIPTESLNVPFVAATAMEPEIPKTILDNAIPVHEEVDERPLSEQPKLVRQDAVDIPEPAADLKQQLIPEQANEQSITNETDKVEQKLPEIQQPEFNSTEIHSEPSDKISKEVKALEDQIEAVKIDELKKKEIMEKVQEPEVKIPEPKVEISESEVKTTEPEVKIPEPVMKITEPEVKISEPVVKITEPEVKITEPEVKTTEPEVKITEPEVKITEPEVKITEPEVKITEPEVKSPEPVVSTLEPEVKIPESEIKQQEPEIIENKFLEPEPKEEVKVQQPILAVGGGFSNLMRAGHRHHNHGSHGHSHGSHDHTHGAHDHSHGSHSHDHSHSHEDHSHEEPAKAEKLEQLPEIDRILPQLPEIQEPPILSTETISDLKQEESINKPKMDSDPMLARFERSGGVGSVSEVTKNEPPRIDLNSLHDHVEPAITQDEKDDSPGFFGGLYNKFFGGNEIVHSEQNGQHVHEASVNTIEVEKTGDVDSVEPEYCEKLSPDSSCPKSGVVSKVESAQQLRMEQEAVQADLNDYLRRMLNEAIGMMDLIISMGLTGVTVLIFTLGYYCINKARKEGPLINKINVLERQLMAVSKESQCAKGDLMDTRNKLTSIEDNSFGSNDMVIALKRELEECEQSNYSLQEQIVTLEKELENAAEAGLELNKMLTELLNNQNGSDSIISSVEDLQQQLNEQQETIVSMNEALATKSRENSELQIHLSELSAKYDEEVEQTRQQIEEVIQEKDSLQDELEKLKQESDAQVNGMIDERNKEVTRLNKELTAYSVKNEELKKRSSASENKYQALEECLNELKKGSSNVNFQDVMDVTELKADLLAMTKEKTVMQDKLHGEKDARLLLEDHVKAVTEEVSTLKKEFNLAEKEKVEAITRLEVLSNYFKDKELSLQKELSIKEAMWMKQQGETTSTVEKVRAMNDEIQTLKSQNDALRAEIEAQVAAHKVQISMLEGRAHEAWLNARQAERRLEEARIESAALRRKLTSIAEIPGGANMMDGLPNDSLPSPIRVESPNGPSSLMGMIPPPFMPQFMPGAPPFMPPFMPPPGEMRLPPLGRLMSPLPKRFSPDVNNRNHRGRYSPDSRYDYSNYDETETDFSPPPSPPRRSGFKQQSDRSKKAKGNHSSDSNPSSRREKY